MNNFRELCTKLYVWWYIQNMLALEDLKKLMKDYK